MSSSLFAFFGRIVALIFVFLKGKSTGKLEKENETNKAILENTNKANQARSDLRNVDGERKRVRKKFGR